MRAPTRRRLLLAIVLLALMAGLGAMATAQEMPASVVAKLKDAVVLIEVKLTTPNGQEEASGSGFVISPDGQIITNAHVVSMVSENPLGGVTVATERKVSVVFHPGTPREETVEARVLRENHEVDLALLKIDRPTPVYLSFVDSDSVVETTRIYVCGHPLGLREFSIRTGTVTAHRTWEGKPYLEHDAAAEEGNSGGPVVLVDGSITGVHTLTLVSTGMLTKFAIPSKVVTAWLATDPSQDPPPKIPGKKIREMLAMSNLVWEEQEAGTFALTPEGGPTVFVHEFQDFLRVYAPLDELPGGTPYLQGAAALAALRFNYDDPVGRLSVFDDDGTYYLYWEAQVPMSVATVQYLTTLTRVGSLQVQRWQQLMNAEPLTEIEALYPGGDEAALTNRLEEQIKAANLNYETRKHENREGRYFLIPYDNDVNVYASIWNGMVYTRCYTGGMPGADLAEQGKYAIKMLIRNWDDPFGRLALNSDNDLVWESQVPFDFITPDYMAILAATCASQVGSFWEKYGKTPRNG